MNILVTGGTGFLGKHIQQAFDPYKNEYDIEYSRGRLFDLTIPDVTASLFAAKKPDVVLHMAAVCGGIRANKNRPADFLRDNTRMALNVYEAAQMFGVKKVYSLGSVCAFPKFCPVPFREDDIWNGPAEETNFPYGQAKRTLMMLGQTYRTQYGIGGAHFIVANMFGSHDHFDLVNSHVIPALINKFTSAKEQGKSTVSCWGTGEATREFLYAGDAAQAIVKAIVTELDTDLPINLGTGIDISIKDLAHLIGQLIGFKGKIEFTGEVSDGQPRRRLDVSRAKAMLGWEAMTKLSDGLTRTIRWYQDSKEKNEKE
ncbi:MAG TPA: NAD-dependent epimerase/dehydratase family protein [Paenisporosarcina sp.]|nr:NAD-dependent epimerase/dehydratase family protein [Paenisporosarcina sp.]